ncbi:MAG: 2-phosphosulfolactate phosphatase [Bacteroidetes bacterium]|nr:2-phosphosulfolactate phosphatase [Bacteroidota bacterium]
MHRPVLDVCLTPALFPLMQSDDAIVVVIDILRATSSMCIAFEYGATEIIPVRTVEESLAYKAKGYLIGAERHGEKIEGFDLGNSPFSYMEDRIKGSKIALTTTNGTQAINAAKNAAGVVIGSFLNVDALCDYLLQQNKKVICLCSGWKNSFNLEDTLLAGCVVEKLHSHFGQSDMRDAAIAARHLYNMAKGDLYAFLDNSSHRKRLANLHIEDDVRYCLQTGMTSKVPFLDQQKLICC